MSTTAYAGKPVRPGEQLEPWLKRRDAARADRKRYEPQWMTSQHFMAGKQHAAYIPREHRMLVPPLAKGKSRQTADRLTQYAMTVVGQLAADDFRGALIAGHDDAQGDDFAETLDKLLGYGWDREWHGDRHVHDLIRKLVCHGTGAIRCRFDKAQGREIADVPFVEGKPLLDPEQARKHVAEAHYYGEPLDMRSVREGRVVWETLSVWNLLPPPGVEHSDDFPWEIVVRPVHIDELRDMYPDAAGIEPESMEAMDVLGVSENQAGDDLNPYQSTGGASTGKLEEHALVYTGYRKPCRDYPKGETVVFADDKILDAEAGLPYEETSTRPARAGITYFWYWRVPGRMWGRGLIEPGVGPQRIINKRLGQMDELIDRGLGKVYLEKNSISKKPDGLILEVVEIEPGAGKPILDPGVGPGPWFGQDIALQERNIEQAMGVRSVSLGENPPGVTTYSQLVLMREADATKIDPISAELKLGLADATYDSVEAMRKWPPDKRIMILGDNDTLESFEFGQVNLPADYMVRPAKGGTPLRTSGVELQKIRDVWDAANNAGVVALNPPMWLDWYVRSLDAQKAQDLPEPAPVDEQHIVDHENALLDQGVQVPVMPFHNAMLHVPTHRMRQAEWALQAATGDMEAAAKVDEYETHVLEHLQVAQQNALQNSATLPPAPVEPQPGEPPASQPGA